MPIFNPSKSTNLQHFAESSSVFSTKTYNKLQVEATSTNVGLVLSPKGTGGFSLQLPDGTVAGGNNRGDYSVDLQLQRASADQVASGTSSVAIGVNNKVAGNQSVSLGTENLIIAGAEDSVAIGYVNQVDGYGGIVIGNNSNSSQGGTTFGTMSAAVGSGAIAIGSYTNVTSSDCVAIGSGNFINSGLSGNVILGAANQVNSAADVALIGANNATYVDGLNSLINSSVTIGNSCELRSSNSVALGVCARTDTDSSLAFATLAIWGEPYSTQWVKLVLTGLSVSGGAVALQSSQLLAKTTQNQLSAKVGQIKSFTGIIQAIKAEDFGGGASWTVSGVFGRSPVSDDIVIFASTITPLYNPLACTLTLTANQTQHVLAITFTGGEPANYRVVASIDCVETSMDSAFI